MRRFFAAVVMGAVLLLAAPAVTPACVSGPDWCDLSVDHKHLESDEHIIILGPTTELWKLLEPFVKDQEKGSTLHGKEYGLPAGTPLWRL